MEQQQQSVELFLLVQESSTFCLKNWTKSEDHTMEIEKQIANDVSVLRRSFKAGKTKPLSARRASLEAMRRMISENKSLFCSALWEDLHKSHTEAMFSEIALVEMEIQEHLDHFEDWAAPQKVSHDLMNIPGSSAIHSDPLGVCCIFGPWNYPIGLTLKPMVGCLSAGNTCLLRLPDPACSSECSKVLAQLVRQYMDDDIVRVVEGGIPETEAVLKERFDKIFFTGGSFVGKIVARAAAEYLCPVVLELGGKTPAIVDSSINVKIAAKRITWGAMLNAGQTCIRPDYLFVHASVADQFIEAVKEAIDTMYGKGHRAILKSPEYGRVINARACQRLVKKIEDGREFIVKGGHCEVDQCFIEPTVMDFGTDMDAFEVSKVMAEEIFGPILPILRYESLDHCLEFIRERPKPLMLYLFTKNRSLRDRVVGETTSGMVTVNDCMIHMTNSALPFGGVGPSGTGQYGGKSSFDVFSHKKSVMYKTLRLDIPQRYPPYSEFDKKFLRVALYPRSRRLILLLKVFLGAIAIMIALKLLSP